MTESMATLILGGLMLTVLAGGVTWSILRWLHQRTLLNILRLGWFVLLLVLVSVVFVRHEPFADLDWLMPTAFTVGAIVFVARDLAERRDRQVLLIMDIGLGVLLLALLTWIIAPGASLPMTTLVPGMVLAAAAYSGQMLMRFWTHRGDTALADRARMVRIASLLLIPVVVVVTLLIFGGLSPTPYRPG